MNLRLQSWTRALHTANDCEHATGVFYALAPFALAHTVLLSALPLLMCFVTAKRSGR